MVKKIIKHIFLFLFNGILTCLGVMAVLGGAYDIKNTDHLLMDILAVVGGIILILYSIDREVKRQEDYEQERIH